MANCEMLKKCIFFNDKMADMPYAAESFKENYCKDNFEICARYMVATGCGREHVPGDLFPNHERRAMLIISQHEEQLVDK